MKSSTSFLLGAGLVAGGLAYLKYTQPNNGIFKYLSDSNISPETVQKLIAENSQLRQFTNNRLQQLAFQSPSQEQRQRQYGAMPITPQVAERQRRYGAMPFEQNRDTLTRQRQYGAMPFQQSPDILKREREFGAMGFTQGHGTRTPDVYGAFGMSDGIRAYSPVNYPTARPGTIIQNPPPGTPAVSQHEFNRYNQQRQMNSQERQFTFRQMDVQPLSQSAAMFGMS